MSSSRRRNRNKAVVLAEQGSSSTSTALSSLRQRLKQVARFYLDRRASSRVEASDIVQDAFVQASGLWDSLADLSGEHLYRLLRKMVRGHAVDSYRRHVRAQRRTVLRERSANVSDSSRVPLADLLVNDSATPVEKVSRNEILSHVRAAMDQMPVADRQLLVRRHLEQRSVEEIAESERTTSTVITSRHFRALQKLRRLLHEELRASKPCPGKP